MPSAYTKSNKTARLQFIGIFGRYLQRVITTFKWLMGSPSNVTAFATNLEGSLVWILD